MLGAAPDRLLTTEPREPAQAATAFSSYRHENSSPEFQFHGNLTRRPAAIGSHLHPFQLRNLEVNHQAGEEGCTAAVEEPAAGAHVDRFVGRWIRLATDNSKEMS
jgi:hypothetical protein